MSLWSRGRSGTEPTTARSPLKLRAALASAALLVGVVGAVWCWWVREPAAGPVGAGFAVVAVVAAVNVVVVLRRL